MDTEGFPPSTVIVITLLTVETGFEQKLYSKTRTSLPLVRLLVVKTEEFGPVFTPFTCQLKLVIRLVFVAFAVNVTRDPEQTVDVGVEIDTTGASEVFTCNRNWLL